MRCVRREDYPDGLFNKKERKKAYMLLPTQTELMGAGIRRLGKHGWREGLLGQDIDSILPAYQAAALGEHRPSLSIETLLQGEPGCDLCIGLYKTRPGAETVPEGWDERCRSAVQLLKEEPDEKKNILFSFDIRGGGAPDRVAGIYFKHEGDLEAARSFLEAIRAEDRIQGYLDAARRLPRGFVAVYAGHFFGRKDSPIRLETMLCEKARTEMAQDADLLARSLAAAGFSGSTAEMLRQTRALMELERPVSFQFDVNPDGSLRDTIAVTVFYESLKRDWRMAFAKGGVLARNLEILRAEGIADERAELLEAGSFSVRVPVSDEEGKPVNLAVVSWPACCKMKWTGGRLLPARWYQRMEAGFC